LKNKQILWRYYLASIITTNDTVARIYGNLIRRFIGNASTRFIYGGQLRSGGELAIRPRQVASKKAQFRVPGSINAIYGDRLGRLHCSVFSNQSKVFTE
jgi:hypothetical protein